MFGIGHLFDRIKGAQAREYLLRKTLAEMLKKHLGVEIPLEDISFKGNTAQIKKISQSARSAIYIKKQKIIQEFNSAQQIRSISDIR